MKILLVHPPTAEQTIGENFFRLEPLALEYWGGVLKDSHTLKLSDLRLDSEFPAVLEAFAPDAVILYCQLVNLPTVKQLSRQVKTICPGAVTIISSPHARLLEEKLWCDSIDIICYTETPHAIRRLAGNLKNLQALQEMPELGFRDRRSHSFPQQTEIGGFPPPARELTAAYRQEYYFEWHKPAAVVRTAAGGAFQCEVGSHWKELIDAKPPRPPAEIVAEVNALSEDTVYLCDGALPAARLRPLLEALVTGKTDKKIILSLEPRVPQEDAEILRLARAAGVVRIIVPIAYPSGRAHSPAEREALLEADLKLKQSIQEAEITIHGAFTVDSGFSLEDFDTLVDFVQRLGLASPRFYLDLPPLKELLSRETDTVFADFFHVLSPPRLSITRFYRELYFLYNKAIIPRNRDVMKQSVNRDIFWSYHQFLGKIKNAYKYAGAGK